MVGVFSIFATLSQIDLNQLGVGLAAARSCEGGVVKQSSVVAALGCAVFVIAAWNGYAWEMLWLPAVVLAAAWPARSGTDFGRCVRRLRRRE